MRVLKRPARGAEASPEFLSGLFAALEAEGVRAGGQFVVSARMAGQASGRPTDPDTSRAAAASIGRDELRQSQKDVLRLFEEWRSAMTDEMLVRRYERGVEADLVKKQSESGIRSRRRELVDAGFVIDTGMRHRMSTGRMAVLWGLPTKTNDDEGQYRLPLEGR